MHRRVERGAGTTISARTRMRTTPRAPHAPNQPTLPQHGMPHAEVHEAVLGMGRARRAPIAAGYDAGRAAFRLMRLALVAPTHRARASLGLGGAAGRAATMATPFLSAVCGSYGGYDGRFMHFLTKSRCAGIERVLHSVFFYGDNRTTVQSQRRKVIIDFSN